MLRLDSSKILSKKEVSVEAPFFISARPGYFRLEKPGAIDAILILRFFTRVPAAFNGAEVDLRYWKMIPYFINGGMVSREKKNCLQVKGA
jgi:hypothetical protein